MEKLIRPVRCHICQKPMYYSDDERHVPEVNVLVTTRDSQDEFYAHVRCWNERMDVQ